MKKTSGTSIKSLVQAMQISEMDMLEGMVLRVEPLEIQITNDESIVLDDEVTYIPQHLTDYKVEMTIPSSGGHSQYSGSGIHTHEKVEVTIYNALKKGDIVHLLSFADGKLYYVLDRVVE